MRFVFKHQNLTEFAKRQLLTPRRAENEDRSNEKCLNCRWHEHVSAPLTRIARGEASIASCFPKCNPPSHLEMSV